MPKERTGSSTSRLSGSDFQRIVAVLESEADGANLIRRLQAALVFPTSSEPSAFAGRNELHVRLLGGLAIRVGDSWESGPPPMRGRRLIAYLALHKQAVAPREVLMELLWPGVPGGDAAHRLHIAASGARAYLRRVLGGVDAIACVPGGYAWNKEITVTTDVDTFLHAAAGGRDTLVTARSLYLGELLSGDEGDWIEPLRVRCAAIYTTVLERLAEEAMGQGEHAQALSLGLELVAFDRGHEGASRLVMRCFAALGRRGRALAEFEALRAHLRKHLGVEPTPETRQLIRSILGQSASEPLAHELHNFKA
jgi:DNA-binding SARP family transcriptional activator